jgi:hypothetical protein
MCDFEVGYVSVHDVMYEETQYQMQTVVYEESISVLCFGLV